TRMEAFTKAHLAYLDSLPQRHPNIEDHIACFFRNDQDAVLAALKTMSIKKRPLLYHLQGPVGDHGIVDPATSTFDLDFALGLIDRDAGDYSVMLTLPEKGFLRGARMLPLMSAVPPKADVVLSFGAAGSDRLGSEALQ